MQFLTTWVIRIMLKKKNLYTAEQGFFFLLQYETLLKDKHYFP